MLLADSSAVLYSSRILPQHQSAIMLITTILQKPSQKTFSWLDLACGKGQIITQLSVNIENRFIREKIKYTGYDIDPSNTRIAGENLFNTGLGFYGFLHGDLSNFPNVVPTKDTFDFITCTNTAHELKPEILSSIIIESLIRLSDSGVLFIHDMESLETPELGALTWHGGEIGQLINAIFEVIGIEYRVYPNVWKHSTCNTWTVVIQKQFINVSNDDLKKSRSKINRCLNKKIKDLLYIRLINCRKELQYLQDYGTKTDEKEKLKGLLLHELWALQILGIT